MNPKSQLKYEHIINCVSDHLAHGVRDSNVTESQVASAVRFIDKSTVCEIAGGISTTTLHELQVHAGFPRPRVLSADPKGTSGKSYWLLRDVQQWLLDRPQRELRSDRTTGDAK
jgi:hypothetical protein